MISRPYVVRFDTVNNQAIGIGASGGALCELLGCGHLCCDECLAEHVRVQLRDGNIQALVCPLPDCRTPFSEEIVVALDPDAADRFRQLQGQQFVDASPHVRWCPAPACGRAVACPAAKGEVGDYDGTNF